MPRNFSRFERRGHVAIITMDRPQVLNALGSVDMIEIGLVSSVS